MAKAQAKPSERSSKDEIYWRVLEAAISLDIRRGHLKWTVTELSRASGVTRTLIYYYFGKSKLDLLREAVALFGIEFSGSSAERMKLWNEGRIAETLIASRAILERTPSLLPFYFLNRRSDTELGREILKVEATLKQKIARFFPALDPAGVDAAYAAICGIVFARDVSRAGVEKAVARAFGPLKSSTV